MQYGQSIRSLANINNVNVSPFLVHLLINQRSLENKGKSPVLADCVELDNFEVQCPDFTVTLACECDGPGDNGIVFPPDSTFVGLVAKATCIVSAPNGKTYSPSNSAVKFNFGASDDGTVITTTARGKFSTAIYDEGSIVPEGFPTLPAFIDWTGSLKSTYNVLTDTTTVISLSGQYVDICAELV